MNTEFRFHKSGHTHVPALVQIERRYTERVIAFLNASYKGLVNLETKGSQTLQRYHLCNNLAGLDHHSTSSYKSDLGSAPLFVFPGVAVYGLHDIRLLYVLRHLPTEEGHRPQEATRHFLITMNTSICSAT